MPLILSGGLTAESVAGAIALRAPLRRGYGQRHRGRAGRKDPKKLRDFIAAAHAPGAGAPGELDRPAEPAAIGQPA